MIKKIFAVLLCGVFFLTGCDEELGEPEISITDITPKNGYHYTIAEDCGEGCIYKSGNVMWYYGYKHKTSVPFCSDPACKHEDKTCAAFLPGRVFGYKDKFVIAGNKMKLEAENDVDDDIFVLEEVLPGNRTKREIMRIDNCRWCDTYAYGNKLFIGLNEEYYLDGDYVYASSERNRVYFMVVSLDTLEVELITDCLMDAFNIDIHFWGENDGKLFFDIAYYTENYWRIGAEDFEDIDPEQFTKHMVYDIETNGLSEFTGPIAWFYLNGCSVYFDGKTVTFDRGDKVCRLTSDYELPYGPFIPLLFENGRIYADMTIETGEYVLFIYDTETEKMNMAAYPGMDDLRFVKERENEYIFATRSSATEPENIVSLPKDKCTISEIIQERYNELCKDHYEAYQN